MGNAYANHYLGLGGDDTINGVTVTTSWKEQMWANQRLTGANAANVIKCREMPGDDVLVSGRGMTSCLAVPATTRSESCPGNNTLDGGEGTTPDRRRWDERLL